MSNLDKQYLPVDVETTARKQEKDKDTSQLSFIGNLGAGHRQTALYAGRRIVQDEAVEIFEDQFPEDNYVPITWFGTGERINFGDNLKSSWADIQALFRKGSPVDEEYDPAEHYDELTDGLPSKYHEDILSYPNKDAALRAKGRAMADYEDEQLIALQNFGGITRFTSMLGDVDLPLMFASGGMIGGGKVALNTERGLRYAGLGAKTQALGSRLTTGAYGGAQAGAIVGLAEMSWRDGSNAGDFATYVSMGALGGAVLNSAFNSAPPSLQQELKLAREELKTNHASGVYPGATPVSAPVEASFGPSSVGAAEAPGASVRLPKRTLKDPLGRMSAENQAIIDKAYRSNFDNGFYDQKAEDMEKWLTKMATSKWTTVSGTSFQGKLYRSKSAVLNWLGRNIFESPNGFARGSNTSAVLQDMYQRRIQSHIEPLLSASISWARRNKENVLSGYGVTQSGKQTFFKEVMLERNARAFGRKYSDDADVTKAADALDNAAVHTHSTVLRGSSKEQTVDGFWEIPENKHYTPYRWSGTKISHLVNNAADPEAMRQALIKGLAASYEKAGLAAYKDAEKVARAVIRRAQLSKSEVDTSVVSLLSRDGRDFLEDTLSDSGVSPSEINGIMKRLGADFEQRSKEGFAKSRNEVDMEDYIELPDGNKLQVVDLLSNDLYMDWQRYSRRVSGAGALARHGIINRADRSRIIDAAQAEQRALGEDVIPREELEAMLTNFNGGAVKGYSRLSGKGPQEQGAGVATAKRLTNLAWLNGIAIPQLGETGAQIVQYGLQSWAERGIMRGLNKRLLKKDDGSEQLLEDLAFITGNIGKDHIHFADHLNLDEVSKLEGRDFLSNLQKLTSSGTFLQQYISGFNMIRTWQQTTAALGAADAIIRAALKDDWSPSITNRIWKDYGIDPEDLQSIYSLVKSGDIEIKTLRGTTFVDRLHMDRWDPELAERFGSSVVRSMNQTVQKPLAGEQDAWMHTQVGAIFSHLKTFPMAAFQKQFVRHFQHNDIQAYAAVGMGFSTAYLASVVRAAIYDQDLDTVEHSKRAFSYSNMTGFIPMAYDPLMTVLGMDDKRLNKYSPHSEITPPVVSWANDAIRLPGAVAKGALGHADGSDRAALRTLPYANLMIYGQMVNAFSSRNVEQSPRDN